MSFISVFGMKNFVTVMSDGLVVDLETYEEKDQRYQKFRKISPYQFVAVGGNQGVAEKVFNDLGYEKMERQLKDLANSLRDTLIRELPPELALCQVAIGGVENGRIIVYSFNNKADQQMLVLQPSSTDPVYTFLSSSENKMDLDREINQLFRIYKPKTATAALKMQEVLNSKVANKDKTVNKITFKLAIKN